MDIISSTNRSMDSFEAFCQALIKPGYVRQGIQSITSRNNKIRLLVEKRKLPKDGWKESTIEHFMNELSQMDRYSIG